MPMRDFLRRHWLSVICLIAISDWLRILAHLQDIYAPDGVLGLHHVSWPWAAASFIAALVPIANEKQILFMLGVVTAFIFVLPMFSKGRGLTSFLCWISLWFWSEIGYSYGLHTVLKVVFAIVALSAFVGDSKWVRIWGRIYLTLIYLNAGWSKLLASDWRNGDAVWDIVSWKLLSLGLKWQIPEMFRSWLFIASAFVVIALQLGIAVSYFAPRLQRRFAIGESVVHASVIGLLGLPEFSLLMIFLNWIWLIDGSTRVGRSSCRAHH